MNDAELVRRVRRGEGAAWTELYSRYLPGLWRYVYRQTGGDRHLAEDVASDTILALVRRIGELDPDRGSLAGWLMKVARDRLRDHRRSANRSEHAARAAVEEDRLNRSAPDAAASLEAAEERRRVMGLLNRLSDDERLVLEWKYLENLSVRSIADRLGRTEKAVESVLYRARRSMRSLLEPCSKRNP